MNPNDPRPTVVHLLDTEGFAGTERHVLELSAGLADAGWRSIIACRPDSGVEHEARRQHLETLPAFRRGIAPTWVSGLRRLAKLPRSYLLHAHNGRTMLTAALLASAQRGRISVATQHFISPQHTSYAIPKRWIAARAHRWMNQKFDRIIAVSEAARQAMLERSMLATERIVTIPNGITPPTVRRTRSEVFGELGIGNGTHLVVTVARLAEEKSIDTLLAAAAKVKESFSRALFLILGEGPEENRLRSIAAQLDLGSDTVRFLGFRDDAADFIASADVFVLPSVAEPFGLVILEAMSLGTPVVAVNRGGPVEIVVDGETGLLIPPRDQGAMAAAIIHLLRTPAASANLAESARNRCASRFSSRQMIDATVEVYVAAMRRAGWSIPESKQAHSGTESPPMPCASF